MSLPALVLLPGMMCDGRMYTSQLEALKDVAECQVGYIGGADNISEIATQVLAQAPEKVTRLALMNTNPRAEIGNVKAARKPQIQAVQAGQLEQLVREVMVPRYFSSHQPHAQLDELCVDMALTLGKDAFVRQSLALQNRRDQQATLASFNKPCLVLMGEEDELCPLDRHECMVALLSQVIFVKIHNAGHIPTLEQPAATNAALKQWMAQ